MLMIHEDSLQSAHQVISVQLNQMYCIAELHIITHSYVHYAQIHEAQLQGHDLMCTLQNDFKINLNLCSMLIAFFMMLHLFLYKHNSNSCLTYIFKV